MAAARKKTASTESVQIYTTPQIPTASRLSTVDAVRSVITGLMEGDFTAAASLVDQMWMNPRLRAMVQTRLSSLTKSEVRWHPSQQNRDGRAAAAAARLDWPAIAPKPARWQVLKWGLLLGAAPGQPVWYLDQTSGRQIPRLRPYSPHFLKWSWALRQYAIRTLDAGQIYADSPALHPGAPLAEGDWIFHEPFGVHSWREGYALSAWYSWLGHNWGLRDRYRVSEKVGDGTLLAEVPHGAEKKSKQDFRDGIRNRGAGAVVVLEQMEDARKFNLRPLEFNAQNGYAVVDSAVSSAAADLTILFLGSQTAGGDLEGGAGHDLARSGDETKADIVDDDAEGETATVVPQLMGRWAAVNFGDPSLAPRREVVTDPPARDQARAQMAQLMSQALDNLDKHGVDTAALCEEMRLPMRPPGKGPVVAVSRAPEQPNDTNAPPPDAAAQENA